MAKHLRITGLVQGVGYRYAFEEEARALGLAGWVRNRRDGSVEAMVRGEARALERIVVWSRRGTPASQVDNVEVNEMDDAAVPDPVFRRLPTE